MYTELAAEINAAGSRTPSDDQAPIYIFIYDIQRFRDLRKSDDDFGYLAVYDERQADAAVEALRDVLRDGPPVGIHTIIWCDSVNNMNRTLDRQGMKEFENRILFQMSANDSSTLIDTAGRQQAGREPGPVLQRGREPDREVPALRRARGGMAREGEGALRRPAGARGPAAGRNGAAAAAPAPAPAAVASVPEPVSDGNGDGVPR